MASTYTPAGIELIGDGEQSTTWGDTTNTNWELMEELATGGVSIALVSSTYTLTMTNGATSNGRHAVITFTGTPGGTCTVTVDPNDMQKLYVVKNDSSDDVVMSQGSGANATIASGGAAIVYCDGAGSSASVTNVSSRFDSTTLVELGVTATAAELNKLDGAVATTAEINKLSGLTATTAELNIMDGVTATTAELNIMDGVTATAAELNYTGGVTSGIQTQLDSKAGLADTNNFSAAQRTAPTTVNLSSNQTADLSTSNVFVVNVSGNFSLSVSNMAAGGCYTFIIKNNGAYDINFSGSFLFSGGDPVITSGAGKRDLVSCVSDGTNLYCSINYDLTGA